MKQHIAALSLVVDDYDRAIEWYTSKLGFELLEDIDQGRKRWVVVKPCGGDGTALVLARASDQDQVAAIGNQTGGRVFLFLYTDDFQRDHQRMQAAGVEFLESPRTEAYGTVAVFRDLYGNTWDLLEPSE